jgi:hypothetical protein
MENRRVGSKKKVSVKIGRKKSQNNTYIFKVPYQNEIIHRIHSSSVVRDTEKMG